jgi:thiol-disulfide isomerase/thioredoxin
MVGIDHVGNQLSNPDETEEFTNTMQHKFIHYFSAPWCAPCKSFAPQFDELAAKHQFSYIKVNIDEDFEKARAFGVRAVPCIVVADGDGKELGRLAGGAVTKAKLEQLITE